MAKSDKERKQAERARKQALGLRQFIVWLQPSDWPAVKRYVARLNKRHEPKPNGRT
jgi:hypothetical protein